MGGVIAGMAGADFLCATTPSEHLDLPTKEDVIEGTYVTRIAAHAADLIRPGVRERARAWDLQMAKARAELDWEGQFKAAINPDRARQIWRRRGDRHLHPYHSVTTSFSTLSWILSLSPFSVMTSARHPKKKAWAAQAESDQGRGLQRHCSPHRLSLLDPSCSSAWASPCMLASFLVMGC
jgi:hypothetical protein